MTRYLSIDDCRAAFVRAFEEYSQEGARMRDLLLVLDRSSRRDHQSVQQQQDRLNGARARYDQARRRYVEMVLYSAASSDIH